MGQPFATCSSDPPRAAANALAADADALALAQVARGDLSAFDTLVGRYAARLVAYIRVRVRDEHHAEDLAQEVFLRLFRAARAGSYTGQASVTTWLFTIANNCVVDHLRATRRRPLALVDDLGADASSDAGRQGIAGRPQPPADVGGPGAAMGRREGNQRVRRWLEVLPEEQRQVVTLKVFADLTFSQIAEVMGCPLSTVKSRMVYGLRKLAANLAQTGEADL